MRGSERFSKAEDVRHNVATRRPCDPTFSGLDVTERHKIKRQVASMPQTLPGGAWRSEISGLDQPCFERFERLPIRHCQSNVDIFRFALRCDAMAIKEM